MGLTYFDKYGQWGDADGLRVYDTSDWEPHDWELIDWATRGEVPRVAALNARRKGQKTITIIKEKSK